MSTQDQATRLLPCSVVFISTLFENRRDIMTATAVVVSEHEPLIAVSVARDHLTLELIELSRSFSVAVASEGQRDLVWKLGSPRTAGDKVVHSGLKVLPDREGRPAVPEGSSALLECRVESLYDLGSSCLVIARVVAHEDLGNAPIVWHSDALFSLVPLPS